MARNRADIDQSVTSYNQSGGITARTVIGSVPEVQKEPLCVNAKDGERYACQVRLTVVNAPTGADLRVEAVEHQDIPIDLALTPLNATTVMVRGKSAKSPSDKIVEMAPPLARTYIATVRADEPIANAEISAEFVP